MTGVSTGALIAPFAFLGDEQSIETIVGLYRNPKKDWVKQRWPLYFLPNNISFAEVPGLEREMREIVTLAIVRRSPRPGRWAHPRRQHDQHRRRLARVLDLVAEAQRAVETGDVDRIHASCSPPPASPARSPSA